MVDVFIQHNCNKIVHVDWNKNINFVVHFFTLDKIFPYIFKFKHVPLKLFLSNSAVYL